MWPKDYLKETVAQRVKIQQWGRSQKAGLMESNICCCLRVVHLSRLLEPIDCLWSIENHCTRLKSWLVCQEKFDVGQIPLESLFMVRGERNHNSARNTMIYVRRDWERDVKRPGRPNLCLILGSQDIQTIGRPRLNHKRGCLSRAVRFRFIIAQFKMGSSQNLHQNFKLT